MFDPHERARLLVDEARVAGVSPQDTLWLGEHIAECAECAQYEETVEGIVRGIQSFAFECHPTVSARIQNAVVAHARKPARSRQWVLAAAAALLVALLPIYKSVQDERRNKADALLMERVESRVRRAVPVAMEPLTQAQPEASQ
jgi:hypothetical protein